MCEVIFDEVATVFVDKFRKARKTHRCQCCGSEIKPGDRYLRHFQICDGQAYDEKMCEACAADRAEFAKAPGHMLCAPSYFWELLSSCVHEDDDATFDEERGRYVPSPANPWVPMLERLRARSAAARVQRAPNEPDFYP
jgi:hypothetical protein